MEKKKEKMKNYQCGGEYFNSRERMSRKEKKRKTDFPPLPFCTVSGGIRLLYIGFQIDECAKSLTGPLGGERSLLSTGGPRVRPDPLDVHFQATTSAPSCTAHTFFSVK